MSYNILPVNRINISLQSCNITRCRELNRLAQITTNIKFEFTVKFIGLSPPSLPTSVQIEH